MAEGDRHIRADGQIVEERGRELVPIGVRQLASERQARQTGPGEAFLVQAGGAVSSMLEGGRQLLGDESAIERERESRQILGPLSEEQPVASFLGQAAPFVAGGVGVGLGARAAQLGVRGTIAAEAAGEAVLGGLPAQETAEDRIAGAVLGGVGGGVGAAVGSTAAQIARNIREARPPQIVGDTSGTIVREGADQEAFDGMRRVQMMRDAGYEQDVLAQRVHDLVSGLGQFDEELIVDGAFRKDLLDRMEARGGFVPGGVRANNITLRMIEDSMRSNPFAGALMRAGGARNQNLINEAALEVLGVPGGNRLTVDKIGQAARQNGELFSAVQEQIDGAGGVTGRGNRTFFHHMNQAEQAIKQLPRNQREGALLDLDEIKSVFLGDARVSGQELQNQRSAMSNTYSALSRQQGVNAGYALELIKGIDATVKSAGDSVAESYKVARDRWRILEALEKGQAINAEGDINIQSVDSYLRRDYKHEYVRGAVSGADMPDAQTAVGPVAAQELALGKFFDAIRFGRMVRGTLGDSGTATRMSMQMLLQNGLMGAVAQLSMLPLSIALNHRLTVQGLMGLGEAVRGAGSPGAAAVGGAIGGGAGAGAAAGFNTREP